MKKRLTLFATIAVMAINAVAQPITAGTHTRVETTYGTIEGYQDGSIFTFKGIQYAKAERFMPPQSDSVKYMGLKLRKTSLYDGTIVTARPTTASVTNL